MQMFGPESPPLEWDEAKAYTRQSIEVYYLTNAGRPLNREQLVEAMFTGSWPENFTDTGPKRWVGAGRDGGAHAHSPTISRGSGGREGA